MYKWLLIALASAGFVGINQWQSRSARVTPVTVYAISDHTCSIEQQKADRLVAELAGAGMNYTLHYIDQDAAAQTEFSEKVMEFVQKRQQPDSLAVRFPVVAVRETLLFDQPSLATIQKHR
ncbi:hypothetical protein GlitD10_0534 [Gloeomargarita lithophora Alchichica-D10]|uniref:Uncharacterized protein n=1 Tax=Gloeomargarita lithophora Alchichica-D10 TaxID=1188229 RepID=A0A1J0AA78_9CYAN|nr:hypothetical protein [Gloeomargarita lithophora]APB32848.1 hypothetical protein GlitD10_0534 [Gloeomargarita lithophora Alchichica-D10]